MSARNVPFFETSLDSPKPRNAMNQSTFLLQLAKPLFPVARQQSKHCKTTKDDDDGVSNVASYIHREGCFFNKNYTIA
jgi:hypothetical protein